MTTGANMQKAPAVPLIAARWLDRFAAQVRRAIEAEDAPEFTVFDAESEEIEEEAGYAAFIALLSAPRSNAAVWVYLDRFSATQKLHPWVGVRLTGEKRAYHIFEQLRRHAFRPILFKQDAIIHELGHSRLGRPLRPGELGRPVIELYGGEAEKGVGIYLPAPRSLHRRPPTGLVQTATRFLVQLGSIVGTPRTESGPEMSGQERRMLTRAFVSLRVIRRDAAQAKRAKARDRFRCRLCGFRPEDVYGTEGRACLEAHHLDNLGGKSRTVSDVKRIVTVCANCHRVLHRLPQSERGLGMLRRRIRRSG